MFRYAEQRALDIRSAPVVVLVGFALRTAATGLLAIGASGIVCAGIRFRLGDAALAADPDTATLSIAQCEDLLAHYSDKPDCHAAQTAHQADEALEVRLGAGALGLFALGMFGLIARRSGAWRARARELDPLALSALAALFGLVAAASLGLGADELRRGADDPPRWFSDGGVALAFFCGQVVARRRWSGPSPGAAEPAHAPS